MTLVFMIIKQSYSGFFFFLVLTSNKWYSDCFNSILILLLLVPVIASRLLPEHVSYTIHGMKLYKLKPDISIQFCGVKNGKRKDKCDSNNSIRPGKRERESGISITIDSVRVYSVLV